VAAATATAAAGRGARGTGIARDASPHERKGGLLAALFPHGRRLAVEAIAIAGLIALTAFLVYHFTVHKIVNHRPLGGANVNVVDATDNQSQSAFAVDPANPRRIVGASNDAGLEVVRTYESRDGGKTWRSGHGPAVPGGSCANGAPSVAVGGDGREYLAFLASQYCGDSLTPYLVVTSRPVDGGRWSALARVAPATWKYGFDDAPSLAIDRRSGALYVSWTRGVAKSEAVAAVSKSVDGGRTWTTPTVVSAALQHPHFVRVAVASDGDVYAAGIDAKIGLWIARSTDGAETFSRPRAAAPLLANPSGGCALTAGDPLPKELSACEGPDPSLNVGPDRVYLVYGDVGRNQTPDVEAAVLDRALEPLFPTQVNPPETSKTQQFMPASSLDSSSGVLWACWYDTTFDPNAHRAWFTCSASRDGRRWTPPVRAASEPTAPTILYGTLGASGLYPAVVAHDGVAHAFWADGRVIPNEADIFTAAIPQRAAFVQPGT
jgi:hypothetical protein